MSADSAHIAAERHYGAVVLTANTGTLNDAAGVPQETGEGVMIKVEPLPCPFCGAAPEVFPKDPATEGNAWGSVMCMNDRCPAAPEVSDGSDVADLRGSDAYKALAIKRWNRRANL